MWSDLYFLQPRSKLGNRLFCHAGFTLIELMVTIAIAAVLMTVAVPSVVEFQRNARLSDAVSNFIAAANTARANAMKQGVNTYLVVRTVPDWRSGWQVFADKNFDRLFNAGEEQILEHDALDSSITFKTTAASSLGGGYLLFNGSGYPRMNSGDFAQATIEFSNGQRKRSIIVDLTGRVSSCKTGASADCPALP